MTATVRLTVHDLEGLPEPLDDTRYELIDGELHVSTQPHWGHQDFCTELAARLRLWGRESGLGKAVVAPGVIFAPQDAVAPDLVWVSRERLEHVLGEDGKLHAAPDLMVEVLSPGAQNEKRDKELKLSMYSRYGVREYWIVNWRAREIAVYRRIEAQLRLVATLTESEVLESPLLPGFRCEVGELFAGLPR
jgi:Uma2 family endonuclease